MSHNERTSRQGQRRKQHRWSGPDHFHSDRAHVFQHYDGLKASRISSRPVQEGRKLDYRPGLDELALEHMTQDCSLLTNQLLRLKTLLQLEETDSAANVSEETEDNTTLSQVETLFKEVQVLKEELRSRDKTIAHLTLQCQQLQKQHQREQTSHHGGVRCQCHHQRAPSSTRLGDKQMDRRLQPHYDKATQTYWRPPSSCPQVLQPFNSCLSEHPHQGRPVKTPPTEDHSELTRSKSKQPARINDDRPPEALTADVSWVAGPDKLSHLRSTSLHRPRSSSLQGITAKDSGASASQSAAQRVGRAPAGILHDSVTPRPASATCPRMLQPPRLHHRASLPTPKQGLTAGFSFLKPLCSSGVPSANQTKQLPPPSRGLPCFNAGPQVQAQKPCRSSLLQPLRTSQPSRGPQSSLEEPTQGESKTPGQPKF